MRIGCNRINDIRLGRAGAPDKKVLVAPGVAVEGRGIVARLVSLAVIDASGIAVGLVTVSENVNAVASVFVDPETELEVAPELAAEAAELVATLPDATLLDAADDTADWP